MFRFDGNSWQDKILRLIADGVAERGFHLIDAVLYAELLDLISVRELQTPHAARCTRNSTEVTTGGC